MSKFDNSPSYGVIVLVAIIAAVVSSLITYKVTSGKSVDFAVVDLQRVVAASKDVAALKVEREGQLQELQKMADEANAKLEKIENKDEKNKATEKYINEINAKKEGFDKVYVSALQASDEKINGIIRSVADKKDLVAVFVKGSVVDGGTDITDSVVDMVK